MREPEYSISVAFEKGKKMSTVNVSNVKIESFNELPARKNTGKSSPILDKIRSLKVKQYLSIPLDPSQDADKQIRKMSAMLSRPNTFEFKPTLRSFKDQGMVRIYRETGSNYTNTVAPTKGKVTRFLTESQLENQTA